MKRIRGTATEVADDALEDGALLLLAIRAGLQEQQQESCKDPMQQQATGKSAAPAPAADLSKGPRVAKASKTSYGMRSYVWRGPHRGALALQKQQQQQQHAECRGQPLQQDGNTATLQQQQQQYCSSASEGNSSRRSSVSGAAPSDDAEVAQQQQQQQQEQQQQQVSPRQRDKEWAALTTWLRMNLHHPRTAKKLVLFVGQQDEATGCWSFCLNPGLAWSDVSLETRLRLKTLPVEAEQAFSHKYPRRPRHEWGHKLQKYRPPGSSSTVAVSLHDMVTSLCRIYYQHEPSDSIAARLGPTAAPIHNTAPQQQQQELHSTVAAPVQHPVPPAADGVDLAAAAAAPATAPSTAYNSEMLHCAQQQLPQQVLAVHPGAQLPAAAAGPTAGSKAAGVASADADADADADGSVVDNVPVADCALLPHPQLVLSSTAAQAVQQQQQHGSGLNHSQLPPGVAAVPAAATAAAAVAVAGDAADSCAAAVTPVSAPWTHCMAC